MDSLPKEKGKKGHLNITIVQAKFFENQEWFGGKMDQYCVCWFNYGSERPWKYTTAVR